MAIIWLDRDRINRGVPGNVRDLKGYVDAYCTCNRDELGPVPRPCAVHNPPGPDEIPLSLSDDDARNIRWSDIVWALRDPTTVDLYRQPKEEV